jgi:predicted DNA-binding protein
MTESNILLSGDTHRVLQALAGETGKTITEILEKAVEEYRRKFFSKVLIETMQPSKPIRIHGPMNFKNENSSRTL